MQQQHEIGACSGAESLRSYLQAQIQKHRRYAFYKRLFAGAMLFAAVLAGTLVVINVGTKWFHADQLSALTGLGGVLLLLIRLGKLQEQAKWNKQKQRKLESLYRRLVYEGADEKTISAELTRVQEELEQIRVWLEIPGELSTAFNDIQSQK